jgi:inosine/guanosine/xanthosine phosphorylase family protein
MKPFPPKPSGDIQAAAEAVRGRASGPFPRVAVILGSGLNALAQGLEIETAIPYAELPGFPPCTVGSHEGRLLIGRAGSARVACLQGRAHVYEGYEPAELAPPIRTLRALGAEVLLMASAVGSVRPDLPPGALVLVEDHIYLSGRNPLIGPNDDAIGPRYPDMTNAYDAAVREALAAAAAAEGVAVGSGVYLYVTGPSFETPAEIRAFARLGADVVGMSTALECIIARHCGLKVGVIAVVTNLAAGLGSGPITEEEALRAGAEASERVGRIVRRFLAEWDPSPP